MKPTLVVIGTLFISTLSFSILEDSSDVINGRGSYGNIASDCVQISMDKNDVLTIIFYKDGKSTVRKKSDEVIAIRIWILENGYYIPIILIIIGKRDTLLKFLCRIGKVFGLF